MIIPQDENFLMAETKRFYSPSTFGFYAEDIHSEIPSDAIEITKDQHISMLKAINENGYSVSISRDGTIELKKQKSKKIAPAVEPLISILTGAENR